MPQLANRVLKNAANADVIYVVGTFNGVKSTFVDDSQPRFADWSVLSETTRPTASNNDGHKLTASLSLPHPVEDQEGCCVSKDTPPASYFTVNTMLSKHATAAQGDNLVALLRSYVNSAAFAALVKGGNNY